MKSYCQKSLPSFIFLLLLFAVFTAEPTTAPTTDLKASDVTYHIINSSGTGDQLQAKCKTFGLRGARINDSFSLAEAQKSLSDSRNYWTGLSWHPTLLYRYYWYQDKSLRTTVEKGRLLNHAWFCFLANKYQSKLQIDYCNAKHPFICENNYSVNGEALSYHTISKNISGFGVERQCEMTGRGARINDSKSLNKVIGQIKDNQTYWTALSMTRSRAFLWNQTLDAIVNTSIISMDRWLCFFVSNDSHKLLGEWCEKSHKYLCEPAVAVTTEAAQSTAAPTTNEITPTATVLGKVKPSKATDVVQRAIAEIKALNATEEGSLMNAVDAISKLLKFLEKEVEQVRNDGIDVLIATRELEFFVSNYGKINFKENESRIIYNEHFAMKIEKVPTGSKAGVVFSLNEIKNSSKEDGESISIPPKAFDFKDAIVVCIIYDDIKQWIPGDKGIQLHNNSKTLKNLKLGSRIIAASVSPEPSGTLQENVTISFRPDNEFKKEDIPHCRFWDHSSLNGSWSSRGCSLVKSVNNEITCTCNHLTNFAVLMQVSASKEVSSKHSLALKVITYIGCALSLTGEVLTVIAYCVLMNLKQEQIQIRFNLVVAIAIAQIAFLSGIDATGSKDVCVFVAALIHFFYLAGFAWMLFEGVHLYLMVVKVFNIVVRMRVFYAVAWGVPALIVALSIVIASSQDNGVHSYVHADLCWVSFNNNLIWTFVAPVLLVCLANSVLLGLVVHEILKMQSHNTSETEKLRQGTKAFLVLFPLLGMTWVFGVLSVTDAGLVFQYVFTILSSLQGFLIFMLHVVRNGDVRAEFKRQKRMWKDARSINASLCLPQDQGNTWTNKAVKSNAHELESKCNEAATCPNTSAGYDNALPFYEEKCITPVNM